MMLFIRCNNTNRVMMLFIRCNNSGGGQGSTSFGLHTKVWIVDDIAMYVGSQVSNSYGLYRVMAYIVMIYIVMPYIVMA